ncbi:MAG: hypothetical protein RIQ33_1348 [Bacteroidota bacterium]|jgi:hypothetical protein
MYQSPIRLFNHLQLSNNLLVDNLQISKVKKLIHAEFAIAENGVISIENWDYNKADILNDFEAENFTEKYLIHQQIWNCPSLLHFMENAAYKVAIVKYDEWREILNNETFKAYFAADFAIAFNKCSSQYIYEFNFYMLGELMKAGNFITDEYFDEAFQNMRLFLDSGTKLFKNTNKENCNSNPDFEKWVYHDFGKFVSKLPYGCSENINLFAVAAINLSVELQHLKTKYSVRISEQLTYLLDVVHPEYADLIKKNHEVFSGISKSNKSWWNGRFGLGVGIGVLIIRILVIIFPTRYTSTQNSNNIPTTIISIDTNSEKKLLIDSIIKNKLHDVIQEKNKVVAKQNNNSEIDTITFKK